MRSSRAGRFVVLGLMLFVLVPPAWGATFERQADLLNRLWGTLTGIWAEAGCIIDPHGGCGATPDEGCILDPHGGCGTSPTPARSDEGCIIDPNGGGCSAVQAEPPITPAPDAGCIIDPNGGCAPRS